MITENEIIRRQVAVKKEMEHQGLSALIIVSSAQVELRGDVRYLTKWTTPVYSSYLVFPLDSDPTLFVLFQGDVDYAREKGSIKDVRFSNNIDGDIAGLLDSMNLDGTIGFIGSKSISEAKYSQLMNVLKYYVVTDASDVLLNLRMVKTNQEIECSRKATELASDGFQYFLETFESGIEENVLLAKLEGFLKSRDSEDVFLLFGSGEELLYPHRPPTKNKLKKGNPITLSIELCTFDGYWTQVIRTFSMDASSRQFGNIAGTALLIEEKICKLLVPKTKMSNIVTEVVDIDQNYTFGIGLGHGQGLDMVECPLISSSENVILEQGMIVAIHPHIIDSFMPLGYWTGNLYIVDSDGGKRLTPKIPELEIKK